MLQSLKEASVKGKLKFKKIKKDMSKLSETKRGEEKVVCEQERKSDRFHGNDEIYRNPSRSLCEILK